MTSLLYFAHFHYSMSVMSHLFIICHCFYCLFSLYWDIYGHVIRTVPSSLLGHVVWVPLTS